MKPVGQTYDTPPTAKGVNAAPKEANPVRLKALEAEMERLTHEIDRLEQFLADPDLYATAPAKFDKATAGLLERQERLAKVEEEWLNAAP